MCQNVYCARDEYFTAVTRVSFERFGASSGQKCRVALTEGTYIP